MKNPAYDAKSLAAAVLVLLNDGSEAENHVHARQLLVLLMEQAEKAAAMIADKE